VTTVAPTDPADVTNSGTNGDVVLDFDIPQGEKGDKGDKGDTGDTGAGVPDPVGSAGQIIVATVTGSTEWATLDTDIVAEANNLYYTDARADARAILFAIALGG
jgi:hypothetical protein